MIQDFGSAVTGITVLNDRMYVCLHGNQQIAVYCPETFQHQEYLQCRCPSCGTWSASVLQCSLFCPYEYGCRYGYDDEYEYEYEYEYQDQDQYGMLHLVGCNVSNCLYLSGQDPHCERSICKVAIGQSNTRSAWSVGYVPRGLSVTSLHNLLAASSNGHCLFEYSPNGQQLRQINLQPAGITSPVHVVQLSNDQFGVTHHGPTHQFAIVSSDGQLVQSYGGDAGDLDQPQGIAVDQQGTIRVADQGNNRILVMDPKTLSANPLRLPTDCKLDGPYSIYFDAANQRLLIGEWSGGRIVCCQL